MSVVVAGAALTDLLAHSRVPIVAGTSNPARLETALGGVGRNIAENLARLGTPVSLVAAVGPDAFGEALIAGTAAAGVDTSQVLTTPEPTGTYLAVLDLDGELSVALSDLTGTEALTPQRLEPARELVGAAEVLVIDANLPGAVVTWLLDVAAGAGVPVVVEPVSVVKAGRVARAFAPERPVHLVTPNADELAAMTGLADPMAAVAHLHALGVANVWVRRGANGGDWHAGTAAPVSIPGTPCRVVDVTGAGDAATAGWVHAHLRGATDTEAAAFGHACAALTVASPRTVRPDLTDALVRATLTGGPA
jgi:pseudouridine kinase